MCTKGHLKNDNYPCLTKSFLEKQQNHFSIGADQFIILCKEVGINQVFSPRDAFRIRLENLRLKRFLSFFKEKL